MKRKTIKLALCLFTTCILVGFTSCKKKTETTTPAPTVPAKTLNKTTLTNNKKWYNMGSSIIHDFKTGGLYGFDGSWKWKNNTDTLEIVMNSGEQPTFWKVYYNTDTEMSCEAAGTGGSILFKNKAW